MLDRLPEIKGSHIKIGVTGSHGHIGGNLFNALKDNDFNIVRLDRSGRVPKSVTHIFDLASYGNKYGQDNLEEIKQANNYRVMDLLDNCQGKTVVLTSSSSVLLSVKTPYSESKEELEELAKIYSKDVNVIVARPSTVIGVGEDKNHLIPKLINSAYTGEEMNFVGDPTHDFLSVDDFVDALLLLSIKAKEYRGQVFNVSFGISVPNEFVLDMVTQITGRTPNIKRVESMRKYDTEKWEVPNWKLKALGWRPQKDIITVIQEMVEDYKKRHDL